MLRDKAIYRAAKGRGLFQKIARLGSRFCEQQQGPLQGLGTLLTSLAGTAVSPGEFLERVVYLSEDPYARLTTMAQRAGANEAQFLEHLILRAEAIYNYQPPVLLPPRPWWKLWSKEEHEPELPAIVADLRFVQVVGLAARLRIAQPALWGSPRSDSDDYSCRFAACDGSIASHASQG